MLTPYVSTANFAAHPTYLDLDDLRLGDPNSSDQAAELNNLLLMSSAWADNYSEQPLAAHTLTQNQRARADRYGNLRLHPDHTPLISISSISYGYTPTALTTLTAPSTWVEDQRIVVVPIAAGGPWTGSLQFGTPTASTELYVQLVGVAGWVATVLTTAASPGVSSLTVADATGIQPGVTYRIWEPGVEENITVSTSFTPPDATNPPAVTVVPLAAPTLFAHMAGAEWSGMPADMRLAVINYTISQLLRPDNAAEDSYPDTHLASGTRRADPRRDGSGLVAEAERILDHYRRIR